MRNIAKILSLIIAITAGLISILWAKFSYDSYKVYHAISKFSDDDKYLADFYTYFIVEVIIAAIALLISIIATFTFRYLHKNKTKNEDNPTILDYDNTSNPNNE